MPAQAGAAGRSRRVAFLCRCCCSCSSADNLLGPFGRALPSRRGFLLLLRPCIASLGWIPGTAKVSDAHIQRCQGGCGIMRLTSLH